MAQTSGPHRNPMVNRLQIFPTSEEMEPLWLKNFAGEWELYSADSQSGKVSRRAVTTALQDLTSLVKTPENHEIPIMLPNAPMKAQKSMKTLNYGCRKKLEYVESEDEANPEVQLKSTQYNKVPGSTKNSVGKQQLSQCKGKKKIQNCDKENDSSLANRSYPRQERKNRAKPMALSNVSKLEGDFSHFRI